MKTDFPMKLKAARLAKGMTQKQLGERSGIADPTIRKYESGRLNPKLETIKRLASALEISVYELMDWDEQYDVAELAKEVEFIEQATQIGGNTYEMNLAFSRLNEAGKQKALAYIKDLLQIDAYCLDEGQVDK